VNALGVVRAAGFGAGLGVATSMSPAVVNVSIVDAAAAGRRWFATGLGLGGAAADVVHAALAFAGVGSVVITDPRLVHGLAIGAAAVILAHAALTWHRRAPARTGPARTGDPASAGGSNASGGGSPVRTGQLGRGAVTGFLLTLPNPAALGAWVAVAAAAWPGAAVGEAAVIAGGVGVGSALWFTLLARWVSRVRRDHPVLTWIPRIALAALIAIAAIGVVRAL
jgi:threonine/homoserine/homoserine lactone efflux protein